MRAPRLWISSLAFGAALSLLAGAGSFYLAYFGRGPGWLGSLCIALGLLGSPFWWAVGVFGAWAGGPRLWTIVPGFVVNIVFWGALFYAFGVLVRRIRRGARSEA